jgi:chromosome segregation ATPase
MEVKKRPLTRDERKATEIGLKRLRNEFEWCTRDLEILDFKLNKLYKYTYDKQLRQLEQERKTLQSHYNELENKIKILDDHIKNGVPNKEGKK